MFVGGLGSYCVGCVRLRNSGVQHFVLSYVCTFLVPFSDALYDLSIKTMFGSSLPSIVWRRAHTLLMLFVFVVVYIGVQHILSMSIMAGVL